MILLTILSFTLSENWFSLSGGGRVFLAQDHIATELGVTFDFDLIVWSGKLEVGKAAGYGVLRCFRDKRLMLSYRGVMAKGRMQDSRGIYTVYGPDMKWKYVGSLIDGLRQGEGRMQWAGEDGKFDASGGISYTGQWQNNDFNGHGVYEENWKRYEGGFRDGRYHGKGKMYEKQRSPQGRSSGARVLVKEGRWSNGAYIGKPKTKQARPASPPKRDRNPD